LRVTWEGRRPEGELPAFAHPGRAIEIAVARAPGETRAMGLLAELHPEVARRFEITEPAVVVELDLDLLAQAPRPPTRMLAIPQFPPARRDLAVETPDAKTAAEVEREIRAAGGE